MGGKDESNITPAHITSIDVDEDKYSLTSLQEMRNQFPNVPDVILARYLIARKDDVEKAADLLMGCLAWKSLYFPILKATIPKEFPIGKIFCKGVDKEGRPLLIWTARKNIAKDRDINEAGRLLMWWTEYTIRQLPENMTKFTILIDRSEFSRENSDLELVKHIAGRFQDLYPERLYRAIIYPADFLFYTIWNVGKWFLDPVTRDKVQPMLQLSGVQQFVDDEHIPASMVGIYMFIRHCYLVLMHCFCMRRVERARISTILMITLIHTLRRSWRLPRIAALSLIMMPCLHRRMRFTRRQRQQQRQQQKLRPRTWQRRRARRWMPL